MIASHWLYRIWAQQYLLPLIGSKFEMGMSFTPDSLNLKFKGIESISNVECKWVDGELVLSKGSVVKESSKTKKNAVVQFKALEGKTVESVSVMILDRLVKMDFLDGYSLVFKGFGRFSNIILIGPKGKVDQLFRLNFKEDWNFNIESLSKERWWNLELPVNVEMFTELIKKHKNIISRDEHFWNNFKNVDFIRSYQELDLEFQNINYNIVLSSYYVGKSKKEIYNDIYNIVNDIIRNHYFNSKFNNTQRQLLKKFEKLSAYKVGLEKQKVNLEGRRSYKEIGDLVISNAHSIKKGVSEALVTDYFTGHRIRIKLNKDLNAAQNAEKFYRKAKNESLELAAIDEKLFNTESLLSSIDKQLEKLKHVNSLSDFQKLKISTETDKNSESAKSKQSTAKKYIWKGIEFWVGKNAKSNDWILRNSTKNDIWLHASGVAGSHGLIRNVGLSKLKNEDLEIAASITAFNSKGRNQSLQTVMYTERKFVSKIKGGNAGQVKVQKFETIDVEPKDFVKFIQS